MGHVLLDLRHAARSLRRVPLFTFVAVLSIAFGIAANTAVFTLVDQVLLRPLPGVRPGELVQLHARGTESYGGTMGDGTELSYAMYRDLREHNRVFQGMFCRFPTDVHVGYQDQSELSRAELVSGTYFPELGIVPAIGRLLGAEEDRRIGGHPVAVLGYDYWVSRFNRDPSAVGRTLIINSHPYEIVGVAQEGFNGLDIGRPVQVYLPIGMQPQVGPAWLQIETRRFRWVQVFARLAGGMTIERAEAGIQPLYQSLLEQEARAAEFASASAEARRRFLEGALRVEDASRGHSQTRQALTEPLVILMGVAGGVLLIVCANVANLLIARGSARGRELALRLAVGARRRDVVRLLAVESLVLAVMGAALGLLLSVWGAELLLQYFVDPDTPLAVSAAPDARTVLFASALAILTALLAGLAPAFRSTRVDLAPALKGSSGAVSGDGRPRLRQALVVTQVALSFTLLVGAGLFLKSLHNLLSVDPGFRTDRMLTFSFDLGRGGYDAARARAFARTFHARVSALPGVSSAAYAFVSLLGGGGWGMGLTVEGYVPPPGESASSLLNAVSPGFFRTLGIPLIAGREFHDRDDAVTPAPDGWPYRQAVVNETFAKRYFGGASPVGRRIGIGEDPGTPMPIEIVGLAKDAHYAAVREEPRPQVFFPYLQATMENVSVYVRTRKEPEALMPLIRREIAGLDSQLPVYGVATLETRVERSVVNERLIATLSAALSAMATLLAIMGLYGVMAYTVSRRTREIGIRMALGAAARQIAAGVVGEAGLLVVLGLSVGLCTAWWLGRYVESQLYGVAPADPWTLALAGLALASVAMLAATVPAGRAARIAPTTALREE